MKIRIVRGSGLNNYVRDDNTVLTYIVSTLLARRVFVVLSTTQQHTTRRVCAPGNVKLFLKNDDGEDIVM